jgi:hypothetical protein
MAVAAVAATALAAVLATATTAAAMTATTAAGLGSFIRRPRRSASCELPLHSNGILFLLLAAGFIF